MCLSKQFLNSQITDNGLVPRGGTCTSCCTYTLWGDIVRGCYRRMAGGSNDILDDDEVGLFESDLEPGPVPKRHQMLKKNNTKSNKTSTLVQIFELSSEGEHFDFDVSSSEESR
jgi:structure-specific endonuclease subunit SLX1